MISDHESQTLGEFMLSQIEEETVVETRGWAAEIVSAAAKSLQAARPGKEEFQVVVYWASLVTAFTLPGNHIFFSRRLLERCRSEAMVAFVIAHEISHHDLGHLDLFPSWTQRFSELRGSQFLARAARFVERRLYGPEQECDADRNALRLCHEAGYDMEDCLAIFEILEAHYLDLGAIDLALGLDPDSDQELSPDAPALTRLRTWAWTRTVGYLPIQDRAAEVRKYAEELKAGRECGSLTLEVLAED